MINNATLINKTNNHLQLKSLPMAKTMTYGVGSPGGGGIKPIDDNAFH
jgi:hypothetical protein